MLDERLNIFRRLMAILFSLFGLPGNILTTMICLKTLCHRTIHFQRKVFHLYLLEISILGKFSSVASKERKKEFISFVFKGNNSFRRSQKL